MEVSPNNNLFVIKKFADQNADKTLKISKNVPKRTQTKVVGPVSEISTSKYRWVYCVCESDTRTGEGTFNSLT